MRKALLFFLSTIILTLASLDVSSQVTVGATPYTTIKAAFDAINAGTHTGSISITITGSTTETASAVLNASGTGSASYTAITISATSAATISGSIAGALIDLNGADNVTINGSNNLILSNTSTAITASTVRFIGDAIANTINQTTLRGAGAAIGTGVVFFSTGTATGNDNNTISGCSIDGTSSAAVGILATGSTASAAIENSGINITNCNIFDFFNSTVTSALGIYLSAGNTDWTISGNSIYQTVPRAVTANTLFYGMLVAPSYITDKHTISTNYFGGSSAMANGTMQLSGTGAFLTGFMGFNVQTGGTGNLVDANIVKNISLAYASASSYTNAGLVGQIGNFDGTTTFSNNQVRDITFANTAAGGYISFQGLHMNGRTVAAAAGTTFLPIFTVTNNTVTNLTATAATTVDFQFYGLRLETSSANSIASPTTLQNPTFNASGNQVTNITITTTGSSAFLRSVGVISTSGTSSTAVLLPKSNILNNTIRDNSVASALASYSTPCVSGIQITGASVTTATDVHTISGNTIYNLSGTGPNDINNSVAGIIATSGTYVVEKNKIYGLSNLAPGITGFPIVSGINLRSMFATSVVKNNFISLGTAQSTNTNFFGFLNNFSSTNAINVYHNSIYIAGTGGTKNSFALYRGNEAISAAITTTMDIKNNILYNVRSGGTGKNYAIGSYGTGTWTSDGNVLVNSGSVSTLALWNNADNDLATYKTNTGDVNSKSVTVNFVSPSTGDLHLTAGSNGDINLRGVSVPSVTTDFDGDARRLWAPYIGGDEASILLPVQLVSFNGAKEGKANKLQWSTSSESNNKGFELQRSIDGKDFSTITFINTKAENGTSSNYLTYNFIDERATNVTLYYRLKQLDRDGKITYSSSTVIIKGDKAGLEISSVYPNPAKERVNLAITSGFNQKATISITDINGKTVKQISTTLNAGDNYINLDINSLASGSYFIRLINSQSEIKTAQFIKN
jgi:trimeric autotransporter adhesin